MKLTRAKIENFKGIEKLEIDFTTRGQPRQLTALIGDNGSGKTTALQAIALTLSMATGRTREPAAFQWPGFLPDRVGSLGSTRVELELGFDAEEAELIVALHQELRSQPPLSEGPRQPETQLTITYQNGKVGPDRALPHLQGRLYANELAKTRPEKKRLLQKLGDVFWFDQNRNLSTAQGDGWKAGVEQLRELLVGWWGYHTSPLKASGKDYISELEQHLARIFPGTRFRGVAPRPNAPSLSARDFYFLLEREGKVYDIAEMASGEQSIFPLLYEFVRLDIGRSIVLIDELELHLHPPEQQGLLAALPVIGPDCQFIITTHSPYLADIIPDDQEVRLPGGRRCL
jgi:predicted ATPase